MKRFLGIIATIPIILSSGLMLSPAALAQKIPQFKDYPASRIYRGKPAPVNLNSNAIARQFRTMLRNGAKKGPNFAGNYTVVMWGCGTSCQFIALVDARNGKVYDTGITASAGASYKINSNLLVVNPPENIAEGYGGGQAPDWLKTEYYVWRNNRFVRLNSQ